MAKPCGVISAGFRSLWMSSKEGICLFFREHTGKLNDDQEWTRRLDLNI